MKIQSSFRFNNFKTPKFGAHHISRARADYFEKEFKKAKKVDILTHESTDRDGANSALALSSYLNSLGVQSRIIVSTKKIADLGLMVGNQKIVQANKTGKKDADTLICVDFSKIDRLPASLRSYLASASSVYCLDHHSNPDISDLLAKDETLIRKVNGNPDLKLDKLISKGRDPNPMAPIYVDTSAKSACSIIYRYFEALGKDIDNQTAYNLFSGFVDDTQKRGLVICDGRKGTVKPTKKLATDANSYEIFKKLKSKLTKDQISAIAKNIDIMSSLTLPEKKFKSSLYNRLKFSKNGTIAYIEIPPFDRQWIELGMDNARTSTILNRFRQSVLNNDFKDPRLDKVKTAATFYRAGNVYRVSLHSKEESLLDFFKYVDKNKIGNFALNSGGHQSRAGGKTPSVSKLACHRWVQSIVSCDDFYEKQ